MRLGANGSSASLMRPEKRDLWPLVIGYGLYLCIFLIGPLGTATLSRFGSGSTATLFSRALMVIGTILMLLVWKAGGKDDFMHDGKSLCLSYGGLLVSYAILYVGLVFGLGDISVYAFSLVFGLSSAGLKLAYYEGVLQGFKKIRAFLVRYRRGGLLLRRGSADAVRGADVLERHYAGPSERRRSCDLRFLQLDTGGGGQKGRRV